MLLQLRCYFLCLDHKAEKKFIYTQCGDKIGYYTLDSFMSFYRCFKYVSCAYTTKNMQ